MKPEVFYYLVETQEASLTFIGGPLKPSRPGYVWLTGPDGRLIFEVASHCVSSSTKDEVAKRILADCRLAKQANN